MAEEGNSGFRQIAFNVANNRSTGESVIPNFNKLVGFIEPRGDQGVQCVTAANNAVSPQASVDDVIGHATKQYALLTGGDGSPVAPKPPVAEMPKADAQ